MGIILWCACFLLFLFMIPAYAELQQVQPLPRTFSRHPILNS